MMFLDISGNLCWLFSFLVGAQEPIATGVG